MTETLTAKARNVEVRNILKKLNDGKTLTAAQWKTIEQHEREQMEKERGDGPLRQVDLARHWNVSKKTVSVLVAKGMPLTSVEDAEDWRAENLKRPKIGEGAETMQAARLEVIRLDAEKRRIQIARMKGEQVEWKLAKDYFIGVVIGIRERIKTLPGISQDHAREICDHLSKELPRIGLELRSCKFRSQGEDETDDEDVEEYET